MYKPILKLWERHKMNIFRISHDLNVCSSAERSADREP
jgi:hypothetical protein